MRSPLRQGLRLLTGDRLGELDDDPARHLTPAYRAFDATGALTDDRIDAIEDATRHE